MSPAWRSRLAFWTSFLSGAFLIRTGCLQGRRQTFEAGLREEGGEAAPAHLSLTDVGVTISTGAERGGRVVDVEAAQPVEADLLVGLVEHRGQVGLIGDVIALYEEVAGVEAEAEALAAARQLDQLGGLVEVAPEQAFVSGGLLEQQRASSLSLSAAAITFAARLHRGAERLALLCARVKDDAAGADPVADSQRVGQRVQ